MPIAVVCQSKTHALLLVQALDVPLDDIVFGVESEALERYVRKIGARAVRGSVRDRALYRELLPASLLVISPRDPRRIKPMLDAAARERGETPVLVFSVVPLDRLPVDPNDYAWAYFASAGQALQQVLKPGVRFARARIMVRRLREALADAGRMLILLQDDPDPDGIACGLALRTLLGRNRLTMPMGSFGAVSRPENRAMLEVLDLEVIQVDERSLRDYDRIVMVDTQPPHLRHPIPRVDAVIDHHPVQNSYDSCFKDVRNTYGATASVLLEYLRAEGVRVNERLATALLYAIRTDTLLLDRPVTEADVEAFAWLFPRSNTNWIRRIERPALPRDVLEAFAEGLKGARIEERVIFSHLGRVSREDTIPQLADFCLQIEGVDWSAVSGVVGRELIMSVRNVGFVQKAGAVIKAAFSEVGSAGGHRSMAKAVIPVERLPRELGAPDGEAVAHWMEERFLAALRGASS
ncbi:MAG: DHH family phosphoesterase [Acidobacteria bacterium]|nr:DHH family phosphoesterase [Acidobacteriota bacterium]